MAENGTYHFRFYLSPSVLLDLARVPEGFEVLHVAWEDDRQAFCFFMDAPHTPNFFVPLNEVLPIYAPAVTKVQDDKGDHLSIRFPQFEETNAPRRRRRKQEG